jgi:hypothetical protein
MSLHMGKELSKYALLGYGKSKLVYTVDDMPLPILKITKDSEERENKRILTGLMIPLEKGSYIRKCNDLFNNKREAYAEAIYLCASKKYLVFNAGGLTVIDEDFTEISNEHNFAYSGTFREEMNINLYQNFIATGTHIETTRLNKDCSNETNSTTVTLINYQGKVIATGNVRVWDSFKTTKGQMHDRMFDRTEYDPTIFIKGRSLKYDGATLKRVDMPEEIS